MKADERGPKRAVTMEKTKAGQRVNLWAYLLVESWDALWVLILAVSMVSL
jgi:hypothetical protein